ncbi:helix-turn-helix transcriptional regulator [Streptomyces sp. H10-C2]|uniref:helix-turn-helix domain-containing protein n=1 Tax=unclassified Streptomyces TaxID=2593676 RepID=UPI0024BB8EB5|nr:MULTISPECIES: helix-turn-helix transcriptional regulator [unclassified Streptomyces]MDJ0341462.1 helix-turn-helix transcriptional regulator [Streptomyces sp. PH10-H1]MDJ0369119.1 helix-turn-helix transcriptional regulator [Streptomyces sp. H10-C2]
MHRSSPDLPRLPFDASAIRRLRAQLGMNHSHIAHAMWISYGTPVRPETIAAWERGEEVPQASELPALAGALWCDPSDLMNTPTTLLEHRWARGIAPSDLARAIGMPVSDYERMERQDKWTGSDRQTAALAVALGLSLPELLTVTGGDRKLDALLREAVATRWQAYLRPVTALVPLPRHRIEPVLRTLHSEYQSTMVTTLNWGNDVPASGGEGGRAFLDTVTERFWAGLQGD